MASTLGVKPEQWIDLTDAGLTRPVRFVARKSLFSQPLVQNFYVAVAEKAADV